MTNNSELKENHLYVAWESKPSLQGHNVYRVNSNIDFKDGKAIFKIANGSVVKIDFEQLRTIGLTGDEIFIYRSDDDAE